MAKLERLKSDEKMYKAFKNLDTSTEDILQKTLQTIKEIEESPVASSEDAQWGAWAFVAFNTTIFM